MNKEAADAMGSGRREAPALRRFAHCTRADLRILEQLPAAARREFERLLQREHRSERAHRRHVALVDADGLDSLAARAVYGDGAGGGRRAPRR